MSEESPRRTFRLERHGRVDAGRAVDEELEFHIELCVEELVADGWSREAARREAERQFGGLEETRDYCVEMQTRRGRGERRAMKTEEFWQDLKYALRTLRTSRGYAGLVILTLAFGIAANTTVFSVMNPYLFRPLPYERPDELVHVNQVNPQTGWDRDRFSIAAYADVESRSRAFSEVAAYRYGAANVTGPEGPERLPYAVLTADMFDVLGAEPLIGRTFAPAEGRPGGGGVAVIGEALWERRYNRDPGVLGRTMTIDGRVHEIVGVMPARFNFPFGSARLWVPVEIDPLSTSRSYMNYQLVGRLNPGWSAQRATEELETIQADLAATYPETDGRMAGITVLPLREALNFAWDILQMTFAILLGAVAFVLLIACVNVASLTLARASARAQEISVRVAIGARSGRIVRQLLTESAVLALAGGSLGVLLSYWATRLLGPVIPDDLYRIGDVTLDGKVLAFSALVTLATPIAFGLFPALRASRASVATTLREGGKNARTSRAQSALVIAQVALAVVLISGAGLMLRSFAAVQDIDLGFEPDGLVVAEVLLPTQRYPSGDEISAYLEEATQAVTRVGGVTSASSVAWLPLNHETASTTTGTTAMVGEEDWPLATRNRVHDGYFETMGIEIVSGRGFTAADGPDDNPVVVVNRTLADRFWPAGDPVGRTLLVGSPSDPTALTVVGVADDVRHSALDGEGGQAQVYRPARQTLSRRHFLVARTAGETAAPIPELRRALLAVDADLPVDLRTMDSVVAENQLQWSLSTVALSIFGGGALLLATLGIYGLVSYGVARRRREMGVRIALGASRRDIRGTVLGDGLRLTVIGLVIGLVASLALGRAIASALYGVSPFDPPALAGTLLLFLGVAALASLAPAERASRTDPIAVLSSE